MSLEKKEAEYVEIFTTEEDASTSDSISRRKKWLDKCFACREWISERLLGCGMCFSKHPKPCHVIQEKTDKFTNRSVPKDPEQDPDPTTQSSPASNVRRTTVQELTSGDRRGIITHTLSASRISSFELKTYLEREYPGQYDVQVCSLT